MTKGKGKKVAVQGGEKKKTSPPAFKLAISKGLDGFDAELEQLFPLYEQLQLISTELADPQLDLLTFAHTAHYFGVLHVERDNDALEEAAHKEMTENEDDEPEEPPTISEPTQPTYSEVNPLPVINKKGNATSMVPVKAVDMKSEVVDTPPLYYKQEDYNFDQIPGPPEEPLDESDPTSGWGKENVAHNRPWDQEPSSSHSYDYSYDYSYHDHTPCRDIAGFVYLTSSQQPNDYLQDGQLRIGLILAEGHRNKGYGRQAVQEALKIGFQDNQCTRVQAILIDGPYKDRALGLFMKCGLGHEGVRRRGFRSPYDFEFKDVTYLGLLATDYIVRTYSSFGGGGPAQLYGGAPKSLWDELFARHQREREELLRWEERQERQLKRTSSMETIRQVVTASADSDAYVSASETESVKGEDVDMEVRLPSSGASERSWTSGSSRWVSTTDEPSSPTKRRRLGRDEEDREGPKLKPSEQSKLEEILGIGASSSVVRRDEDVGMDIQSTASIVEWRAQTEITPAGDPYPVAGPSSQHLGLHRAASSAFSDDSDVEGDVSDGYATSASSSWDVVETGSTSSSSSIEDIDFDDALDIYDDTDSEDSPHAF